MISDMRSKDIGVLIEGTRGGINWEKEGSEMRPWADQERKDNTYSRPLKDNCFIIGLLNCELI